MDLPLKNIIPNYKCSMITKKKEKYVFKSLKIKLLKPVVTFQIGK